MKARIRAAAVLSLLSCASWAATPAPATLPALPHKDVGAAFAKASPEWRDYLLKARAAQEISDPLQRCLAFPDVPGNQWPAGFAESHCRTHYASTAVTLDEMATALERGDLAGLTARLDALQALHQRRDTTQEEFIHDVFEGLDASAQADTVTARWLSLAPDDAYALVARASYLRKVVWKARGTQFANKIPEASHAVMTERSLEALPLLKRAADLRPDLMPIYEVAMDLGKIAGADSLVEWARSQALETDPGCVNMARAILNALEPRWGGSYPAMEAFVALIRPHVATRPLLALYLGAPQADRGNWALNRETQDAGTVALLDESIGLGASEGALTDGARAVLLTKGDRWKAVAYLLQANRFSALKPWADRQLVNELERTDPAWALLFARRAVSAEPENASGQQFLGYALMDTGAFAEAETAMRRARQLDPQLRLPLAKVLAGMWLYDAGLPHAQASSKAKPYVDEWLRADPKAGEAWIMRFDVEMLGKRSIPDEIVQNVVKYADRKDPWQADRAARLEEAIRRAGGKR